MITLLLAGIIAAAPLEDEPGWDCATMGNQHCERVLDMPDYCEPRPGTWVIRIPTRT